jgi:hypothetical protein
MNLAAEHDFRHKESWSGGQHSESGVADPVNLGVVADTAARHPKSIQYNEA